MILDASVVRNFGVLGHGPLLLHLVPRPVLVDVVMSLDGDGEVPGIRAAIDNEVVRLAVGSGDHSIWLAASIGIAEIVELLTSAAEFAVLTPTEFDLAMRLRSKDPIDQAWRVQQGAPSRHIDAGEAACIAVAHARRLNFATDDEPGARTYQGLCHRAADSTLGILKRAVTAELLPEADARADWTRLNTRLRGRLGLAWDASENP